MSKNYDSQVNSKYAQTYDKTVRITKKYLKHTDVVLDYACGTGITTIELSEDVKKVCAIDISEDMISIARNKSKKNGISNIEFDVADIYNEKLKKNSFDVIMAFNILYFIKDIDKVLNRINELLKPNGIFISATDCLGQKKTFITVIQSLLSKIGAIPYIRKFKISELREIIEVGKFSIMETHNLYDYPPNYYIVARKK
ncbi:MAG: class I SAM-dependent methyltransferase [Marinisporobacter sp.]|jgi:ubiquinone/menaquinone biosynthesis C-methylase UbiE|nr:class I SAM-dependent methyltransferase [Marinisporobacter sp.]